MSWLRFRVAAVAIASAAIASVAVATGASAQQPPDDGFEPGPGAGIEELQVLGVEESDDTVALEIALPTAFGRLAPVDRHFGVIDGGREVAVEVVALDTPSTVLVVDISGSMRGPSLAAAKAAARSFVERSPREAEIGLVTFGEAVVVHQEPTLDRDGLVAAIDGLDTADGETALWDALVAAGDLLEASGDSGASVVVLSDGGDTFSSASRTDAIERLNAGAALLYAVAIETPEIDREALQAAVDQVGGQFLAAADVADLDSLYVDIAGRLANRYRLDFTPASSEPRNAVVSVAVEGSVVTARVALRGPGDAVAGPSTDVDTAPSLDLDLGRIPVLGPVTVPLPGGLSGPALLGAGAVSVFGALALFGLVVSRPPAQVQLATATGADRVAGVKARLGRSIEGVLSRHDPERRLDARLDAADVNLRPGEFVVVWMLVTAMTSLVVTAAVSLLVGLMVIPLAVAVAMVGLGVRASRRRSRFADQMTETLSMMASSLRAGQSLTKAIELVADEAASPSGEQFRRIHFEVRVGRDLTESMRDVARRMSSEDLEWLAQAVDIHREIGGDLTEIMTNLAGTIRERRTVARQIGSLSAEGRATGWVLLVMPVLLFLFSWWRTPDNIATMFAEPMGRMLLVIAVVGMGVGHLWIRQLTKLKY